jgi:uncharacterized protein (TIGR03492 family)
MKILSVSNGHGEDAIALPVLQELAKFKDIEISTLPIVGVGRAYTDSGFPLAGRVKAMPSGGFVYMDNRELLRDIQGGLIGLTIDQYRTLRAWAKSGGKILAVGDIVPLLMAWLSRADYAFIGTAKSEYYMRDAQGQPLPSQAQSYEIKTGSVFLTWERRLMAAKRCQAVFPRDRLTTDILRKWPIPAWDAGNPMMDGVDTTDRIESLLAARNAIPPEQREFTVALLPGSRPPEAYANWREILTAVDSTTAAWPERVFLFLAAISPTLDFQVLTAELGGKGWIEIDAPVTELGKIINDPDLTYYRQGESGGNYLAIGTRHFRQWAHLGDCAIAMAGTGTEQFVGLGKPAFTIVGDGPQFNRFFATGQTRLLGESIILSDRATQVGAKIKALFNSDRDLANIAANGLLRMGTPGAAARIAEILRSAFG